MYEYFGVGPEIQEEFSGIFPRFLRWLPKHRLSPPLRRSFFLLFKSLVFGYDLVSSLSEFLCDFLDEIRSLGWM